MNTISKYQRLDGLYYSLIDVLRYTAFCALVLISMVLSITFWTSAVSSMFNKILLGIAAFSLESVKVYTLIYAEYVNHSLKAGLEKGVKLGSALRFKIFKPFALFSALTILSMVATISFAQSSIYSSMKVGREEIKLETELEERENPLIAAKYTTIENKQAQIDILEAKLIDLPTIYVTSSLQITNSINQLNDDIAKLNEEIAIIEYEEISRRVDIQEEEVSDDQETFNRFFLLGQPFGLSETTTLFIFLILFGVLLELGIIATAPAPEKRSIKELIVDRFENPEGPKDVKINPIIIDSHGEKPIKTPVEPDEDDGPVIMRMDPSGLDKIIIPEEPTEVGIDSLTQMSKAPEVKTEVLSPKTKTTVVKKRATALQLLEELYEKGSLYLKSPAQVCYITNRSVDEYLHFLNKLEKISPPGTGYKPLISKIDGKYKMNYSLNYINSIIKSRSKAK